MNITFAKDHVNNNHNDNNNNNSNQTNGHETMILTSFDNVSHLRYSVLLHILVQMDELKNEMNTNNYIL